MCDIGIPHFMFSSEVNSFEVITNTFYIIIIVIYGSLRLRSISQEETIYLVDLHVRKSADIVLRNVNMKNATALK